MTDETGRTDAELVAGVLAADRDAFAAVYDRYGDKLYDFAYSMLRHREDAADAVADSFVIVAERLKQLREPERLRPWLYAIVRSECLRKLRARKRVAFGGEELLVQMADDALTPDQEAERAAMQKIVWDASAGLADRDRALLDLHLRQGLEGAELGEAMGVSASNAYVMVNRLKAQVDRSLGALLIARLGRDDCDELDTVLADWDGTFSPLVRKRVSRHVDDCDVCSKRRKKILSPWMLLAGVPMFTAPLTLRDRVVGDTQLVAYTTPTGEPLTPAATLAPRRRPRAAVTAAAAVVIILSGVAALFWAGDDDASPKGDVVTAPTTLPAPTADAKVTTTPTPTPTPTPSETTKAPGALTVSTKSIALGRSGSTSTITLTNTGGLPVDYRLTSSAAWLTASPSTGRVEAGASSRLAVRADRGDVREGSSVGTIGISWATGSAQVKVSLVEERDPKVGQPSTEANPSCDDVAVSASVTDESRLSSVVLRWSGPSGSGSARMSGSGSRWSAEMGPFRVGGNVTMRVTATDSRGNTASASRTVNVDPCPQ